MPWETSDFNTRKWFSEINEIFIYNFFAFFLIQNNTHLCYKRFCNIPVSIKKGNDKISDFNINAEVFFFLGQKLILTYMNSFSADFIPHNYEIQHFL